MSHFTVASKPLSVTACAIASGVTPAESNRTRTVFALRFTSDDATPSRFFSADCTVDAQFAQVMPGTLSVTDSVLAATGVELVGCDVGLLSAVGVSPAFCVQPVTKHRPASSAADSENRVNILVGIRLSPSDFEFLEHVKYSIYSTCVSVTFTRAGNSFVMCPS